MGEAKRRKEMSQPSQPLPRSDRRQQHVELTRSWSVYASETGQPIKRSAMRRLEEEPVGTKLDTDGMVKPIAPDTKPEKLVPTTQTIVASADFGEPSTFREEKSIKDLPEDQARAIYGDAIYEDFLEYEKTVAKATGRVVVTKIGDTE